MDESVGSARAGLGYIAFWVCLALAVITMAVLGRVCGNDFVNYDDPSYVTRNPYVQIGLSGQGLKWDFTTFHTGNWHPLTWLSLQIDHQLFGLMSWGYHLTNLILHTPNTVLLFLVFFRMTGNLWPSALVAALFALHPLHVESVAWVTERKDVLSTLFGMLTLWSYIAYVERRGAWRYLRILFFLSLGLMAKPTLVILPCVLLLLDYWPLSLFNPEPTARELKDGGGRIENTEKARCVFLNPQSSILHRRLLEKLPLFAVATASCIVTLFAQQSANTVRSLESWPLSIRVANSFATYAAYIGKMFWPFNLAVFYPRQEAEALYLSALSAVFLIIGITAIAAWQ